MKYFRAKKFMKFYITRPMWCWCNVRPLVFHHQRYTNTQREISRSSVFVSIYGSDAFWNLHPKPSTISVLEAARKKIWDNFPKVQLTKLSRVLEIVFSDKSTWSVTVDILRIFLYAKKV